MFYVKIKCITYVPFLNDLFEPLNHPHLHLVGVPSSKQPIILRESDQLQQNLFE